MCASSFIKELSSLSVFSREKFSFFFSFSPPFFSPPSFLPPPRRRCLKSSGAPSEKRRENSSLCRFFSSSFLPFCMDRLSDVRQQPSSSISLFLARFSSSSQSLTSFSSPGESCLRSLNRLSSPGSFALPFLLAFFLLLPSSSSCSRALSSSFSLSSPVSNRSLGEEESLLFSTCADKQPLSLTPSSFLSFPRSSFSRLSSSLFSPSLRPLCFLSRLQQHQTRPRPPLFSQSLSNKLFSSSSSRRGIPASSSLFFSSSSLLSAHPVSNNSFSSPPFPPPSFLHSSSSRRSFSSSSSSSTSPEGQPSSSSSSSRQSSSSSSSSFSSSRMSTATFQRGDGHGGEGLHIFPPSSPSSSSSSSRDPCLSTVIFLHGLGDTAAGWRDVLPLLSTLPCFLSLRIILPSAPVRAITLNGGMPMPAWGDIFALTRDAPEDRESYLQTKARIDEIIRKEVEEAGVPPERILLGGFSQGGAMAYLVGLQSKYRLGGIIALSTWLPLSKEVRVSSGCLGKHTCEANGGGIKAQAREEEKEEKEEEGEGGGGEQQSQKKKKNKVEGPTPILHCHGEMDELVLFSFGEETVEIVRKFYRETYEEEVAKNCVEFFPLPGLGHSANALELAKVREFIQDKLKLAQ